MKKTFQDLGKKLYVNICLFQFQELTVLISVDANVVVSGNIYFFKIQGVYFLYRVYIF